MNDDELNRRELTGNDALRFARESGMEEASRQCLFYAGVGDLIRFARLVRQGWEPARPRGVGVVPFPKGGWQHAVDDQLVCFGRTSQEFATSHEAVQWLLEQTVVAVRTCNMTTTPAPTDDQITVLAMKHNLAHRDAIHPFARELLNTYGVPVPDDETKR